MSIGALLIEKKRSKKGNSPIGHKNSKSTDHYTSFKDYLTSGKFDSAIVLTPEEARRLVENGWQHVCDV